MAIPTMIVSLVASASTTVPTIDSLSVSPSAGNAKLKYKCS